MATEEQLVLDGLTLNDATFGLLELNAPPPRQRREWIGAADSEWQALARNPLHENREITARIQIRPQATTDLAMDKTALVIDKLRLASRTGDGIALTWTPAEGTRTVTFDVLAGEITDLPIDWASGWLAKAPTITVQMSAKPYWRGTETLTTTASSSTPFVTKEITGVTGDIPALGRLIVTDTATQSRRHVEWGIEGQYYNAATSLLIDSDDMVTSGFAGAQASTTGAYDPNASGNNSITCALTTATTAVAGTGNLSHVGAFRVKARVQATTSNIEIRLAWQAADGPWNQNGWIALHAGASNWEELNLGEITIPTVITGTQRWTGRLEARTTSATDTLKLDYLVLVPTLEGYGIARATTTDELGVVSAFDDFTGTTSGGALNARTPVLGAAWATSGAATDFAFIDAGVATHNTTEAISRSVSTSSARHAVFGSAMTDMQVRATLGPEALGLGHATSQGVITRWTDSSNFSYFIAVFSNTGGSKPENLIAMSVWKFVAGAPTQLTNGALSGFPITFMTDTHYMMDYVVRASGTFMARLLSPNGTVIRTLSGSDSAFATGGALQSGKPGIVDAGDGTNTVERWYDDVTAWIPGTEPIVLYSGRNMQFRHDDTIRQDSTGTYAGRPPSYRGSRFLVPVGTSRVLVKARRNDIETTADANVTDATQIQIGWTPRGIAVPR